MGNKQGHHEHDEAKEASQAPTEKAKPTKEAEDREFQLRQHRMKKRHSVTGMESDIRMKYDIDTKELGHGHYGVVRIGTLKATGETFAVKTIRKVKVTKLEPLKREIEILQECDHPHIIKLIEVVEDEKSIHLVQELCTGGELFDRIIDRGHYTEHDAKKLLYKLLTAVNHCHTKHIVHRDLKPENFIFKDTSDDADVKVIDFGLSCYGDNDHHMHTRVGTPYYIAPEVLAKDYTAACDIWSLGVILYILLCGFPPFYGDSDPEIFNRVKAGKYDFDAEEWAEVSTQAKELIGKMLCMEYKGEAEGGGPARRPTAKECIDDPWFADVDADDSNHTKTVIKPETVKTLKAFVHHNKLKKAALGVIAHHMTENEIGDLRSLFEQMDTDKTGIISVEGLSKCMHAGGYRMLEVEVRSLIEGLDINGNHKIDYSEFLAATIKRNQFLREERLHHAFDHFDVDGTGFITIENLVEAMGSQEHVEEIIAEVDQDHDGRISYDEFHQMMESKGHDAAALTPQAGKTAGFQ